MATTFATGEEAVLANFDRSGSGTKSRPDHRPDKRLEQRADRGEGSSGQRKDKGRRPNGGGLVAAADRQTKPPAKRPARHDGHFNTMLDGLCPNHSVPVKHTLRNCQLARRFFKSEPEATRATPVGDDTAFPEPEGCFMIYGGNDAYDESRRH